MLHPILVSLLLEAGCEIRSYNVTMPDKTTIKTNQSRALILLELGTLWWAAACVMLFCTFL